MALVRLMPLAILMPAWATTLPHFAADPTGAKRTAELERSGEWWAHLGDRVYHAPPAASGLSGHARDYYYAFGSESALTDELRDRKVGGQGRLHLFHIPEGPSMLQLDTHLGNRRNALSALSQLKEGMRVSHKFPPYAVSASYRTPLSEEGQALEKAAVTRITADLLMSFLKNITSFDTRSWANKQASTEVQHFLQSEFEGMDYTTCLHSFGTGGPSTNIVGFVPGNADPEKIVLVGAHYDSIPAAGHAPGAEDNGSGVAALLAIMKAFKDAGIKPEKSVIFVAFAGEEPGLLGSNAFAGDLLAGKSPEACRPQEAGGSDNAGFLRMQRSDKHQRSAESVDAIIMDEVGWLSPSLSVPTVNLESYDWTQHIMEHLAQASADHNGRSLLVVHSPYPFGSDHMSFLDRKTAAVLTINGDDEAYPYYHSSQDEISSVNGTFLSQITRMNMGGLLRIAGMHSEP